MSKKRYTIVARCYDKRGRLLSVGTNSYSRSHPIQKHFAELAGLPCKIFLHAEVHALIKAGDNKVHTMIIEGVDMKGNIVNSCPCPICQEAIRAYGVKAVKYTLPQSKYRINNEEIHYANLFIPV